MTIRPCETQDFESLKKLLQEFHEEALNEYGLKCEKTNMENAIKQNYENAIVLVIDNEVVGVIAGKTVDYPLQEKQIFQEMIWFVSKKYRMHGIKLLRALEAHCKERGIQMIIMVALGSSMKEKLDRVYKIMGYNELETHYIKVMG